MGIAMYREICAFINVYHQILLDLKNFGYYHVFYRSVLGSLLMSACTFLLERKVPKEIAFLPAGVTGL